MDDENSDYISAYRELRPEMFETVTRPGRLLRRESTRVIEVEPRRILLNVWSLTWDQDTDFEPHALVLNVPEERAYKITGAESDPSDLAGNPAYWE